jgi:sulfonate transport system substrate-binding protein
MKKLTLAAAAAAAAALLPATAAQARPDAPAEPAAPQATAAAISLKGVTLRVGGQTDGLQSLLVASGVLTGKAYAIKWSTFSSGPPILEALQAGKVDLGGVGNTPPLFAAANRSNFRIVAAIPQRNSNGDSLLVPKSSSISSIAQLKGKSIAYTRGSSGHGFLVQALKRAGLKPSDVQLKDLTPADALAAFTSGKVDAWATWEPFITIASGSGKVIANGKAYAASGLSFVTATTGALSNVKKRTAIRDYLVRLRKALKWGVAHQDAWAKAFNQESGLPVDIAKQAIGKTLVDLRPATGRIITTEQKLADALADAGALKRIKVRSIVSNQLASK